MNIVEKNYNESMLCILDIGVHHPVEVLFHASGRDFTFVELCHEPTQFWEENEWRYGRSVEDFDEVGYDAKLLIK